MPRDGLRISVWGMAQKGDSKSIFAVTGHPSSAEKARDPQRLAYGLAVQML